MSPNRDSLKNKQSDNNEKPNPFSPVRGSVNLPKGFDNSSEALKQFLIQPKKAFYSIKNAL